MPGIFISYRKDDGRAWTLQLRDHLARQFGAEQIFLDVDSLAPGGWRAQIDTALTRSRVVLVVIGARWANAADASGQRRLFLPDDVHRVEVATALSRADVTVIPVLVDGARLPLPSELPEDLQGLIERQAREIGDALHRRSSDLRQLTREIAELTGVRRVRARATGLLVATAVLALSNTFIEAGSALAALLFLVGGALLALMSWQTYRQMVRDRIPRRWMALLAVILSSAIAAGSVIRLML